MEGNGKGKRGRRGKREIKQKLTHWERDTQAGGGRISASLGRMRGVGRGWGLSLKEAGYPGDKPGQQIITRINTTMFRHYISICV